MESVIQSANYRPRDRVYKRQVLMFASVLTNEKFFSRWNYSFVQCKVSIAVTSCNKAWRSVDNGVIEAS